MVVKGLTVYALPKFNNIINEREKKNFCLLAFAGRQGPCLTPCLLELEVHQQF